MANQANSLSHTKWMCKYHIVSAPKYRRKITCNQYRDSLGEMFRQLRSYKGVEIIEGRLMPDHVHMLAGMPPKPAPASFMGYPKGKSALMMRVLHANLKHKFGNRHFRSEGHCVSTVGLNEAAIRKYIQEQEAHDIAPGRLSVKEHGDPSEKQGGGSPLQGRPAMREPLPAARDESRAMRPEQSEGQRLETPPATLGLIGPVQTTLLKGGS